MGGGGMLGPRKKAAIIVVPEKGNKYLNRRPNCLPEWLYHFVFPPAMNESCCYTSLSVFSVVSILDFGDCNRCAVLSPCLNLQSPNEKWCWASFHILICHLYVIFDEQPDLLPIFNWLVHFSLLSFTSRFRLLESDTLSDIFCKYFMCGSSYSLDGSWNFKT